MAKLGDQGGLLTWAAYVRWPFTATGVGLLGLFIGFILGGFLGALLGLVGGAFFGAIFGMVLGINREMFPVIIEKYVNYGGGGPSFEGKYPGRVRTLSFSDEEGGLVERRVVEYLQGTLLRQMSNFSLPVWYKDGETRRLTVLQVDSFSYLPMVTEKGVMYAEKVPVYKRDENKEFVRDDKGNFVQETNEKGEPMFTKVALFDANVQLQNEKIVPITKGIAAKLDNDRVNYTMNYRINQMFNRRGDFWQKYGYIIVGVVSVLCVTAIVLYGFIKFGEISADYSSKTNAAVVSAAKSNEQASILNAQVANALLKAGFNVNTTFCVSGGGGPGVDVNNNPQLPFLGGIK